MTSAAGVVVRRFARQADNMNCFAEPVDQKLAGDHAFAILTQKLALLLQSTSGFDSHMLNVKQLVMGLEHGGMRPSAHGLQAESSQLEGLGPDLGKHRRD
mmetsp:Transcript_46470/g.118616  ORF Transcript_46470/g.118616 Transcript_46470/m.118616 type:complete len:100 (+) Transcript_46470:380-679(+)